VFDVNGSAPSSEDFTIIIQNLFGGTSIASIVLAVLNFIAALGTIILIFFDNRRNYKTWKPSPSNRIPLAIAVAIFVSHIFFMSKAFVGIAAFHTFDPPKDKRLACKILNEIGFWGTPP
jgi:hypothetical protein